jgi:HipA-like protein
MDLLETAQRQDPLLALIYFRLLPRENAARAALQMPNELLIDVIKKSQFTSMPDNLLWIAIQYARLASVAWELPTRHLLEHGTDPYLRIDAALELENWSWLHQAVTSPRDDIRTAAQAAFDVGDTLADVLRAGRLRTAGVFYSGTRVGLLSELSGGPIRFTYDRAYLAQSTAQPIAPTLPLRPEPFDSFGLHPVFEELIPQGGLLDINMRKYRLKAGDHFGLLLTTGRHTLSAIAIIPEDDP